MSRGPQDVPEERRTGVAAALVAFVALLPFARGLLAGQCLFFRDLSLYFFPLRRFVLEGLLQGHLRYWNPLVHEGKQEIFSPIGYPIDLLQLLLPDERGFTLLLVLHVPLAAVAFFALARTLRMSVIAAAAGGVVYALGGFALSLVNLYDYIQAAAWAPLFALGLLSVVQGRPAAMAGAAITFAVLVSSGRVEIVIQAVVLALVLAWPPSAWGGPARVTGALLIGTAVSAPVWTVLSGVIADSGRGAGLSAEVVLAHSIHPLTLLQTLIGSLYGDMRNPVGRWWGDRFFSAGFPYFQSLYLGATVLSLAILGATRPSPWRKGILCLAAAAAWLALGAWGGWTPLVEAAPFLRRLRFPSKAFFTLHTTVALFAATGLDVLARSRGERRIWGRFALLAATLGGLLVLLPPLIAVVPGRGEFLRWFFPSHYLEAQREAVIHFVIGDAAAGGGLALVAAAVCWMVGRGRVGALAGAAALVALLTADLLRTGAGLNPMVTPAFFDLSPEMSRVVDAINSRGGRAYTCHVPTSDAYVSTRPPQAEDRDVAMFTILRETLTPSFNLPKGPPAAYSSDLTGLVPLHRVLDPSLQTCAAVPTILGALRGAAVSHVISLDPLAASDLVLEEIVRPERIAPLAIHVYALARPLPRRALAAQVVTAPDREAAAVRAAEPGFQDAGGVAVEGTGPFTGSRGSVRSEAEAPDRLTFEVVSDGPGTLVIRDAFAAGWRAFVNGVETPILRADGRHRAVPVPAGPSRVTMTYRPPGFSLALVLCAGGLLAAAVSVWRDRRTGRATLVQERPSGGGVGL